MITRITLFLTLLLCCLSLSLPATHNRSGEIEYRQLATKELEASVITYTNVNANPADRDTVTLCWGDGVCERIARVNGPDLNGNGVPDGEIYAPDESGSFGQLFVSGHPSVRHRTTSVVS